MAPEARNLPPKLYGWPPEKDYVPPKKRDGTHPVILAFWSLVAFALFFYVRHLCSLS